MQETHSKINTHSIVTVHSNTNARTQVRFLSSESVKTITRGDLQDLARAIFDSDEFIFASGDPTYGIELSPDIVSHLLNAFDVAIAKFRDVTKEEKEEQDEKEWLRVALRWAHSIASIDKDSSENTTKPIAAGVASGLVPDENMSSSSIYGMSCRAHFARLHLSHVEGWCPQKKRKFSKKEFLEIDLGRHRVVVGVQTMGSGKYQEWVESYYVYTSSDGKEWDRRSAVKKDSYSRTLYSDILDWWRDSLS